MTAVSLNEQARRVAASIDHTLLRADATHADVVSLCEQARAYGFATVCVNPCFVSLAAAQLEGSGVGVCTVVGFPLGANLAEAKAFEARMALGAGATELDMVMSIASAKEEAWSLLEEDIRAVVAAAARARTANGIEAPVKVILECCLLGDFEKARACESASAAGAAYVKTSTGFSHGGATCEDVRLLSEASGENVRVKASGGIRTAADALAMLEAGADRLGASASVTIVRELGSDV